MPRSTSADGHIRILRRIGGRGGRREPVGACPRITGTNKYGRPTTGTTVYKPLGYTQSMPTRSHHQPDPLLRQTRVRVLIFAAAFSTHAGVRLAIGSNLGDALRSASIGTGSVALTIISYVWLRALAESVETVWNRSLTTRTAALDVARRAALVEARGDRHAIAAIDHHWPEAPELAVRFMRTGGTLLLAGAAYMIAVGIVSTLSGNADIASTNLSGSPFAFGGTLLVQGSLVRFGPLLWRWLGVRAGSAKLATARRAISDERRRTDG